MINRGATDPPRAAGIDGVREELRSKGPSVLAPLAPPLGGLARLGADAAMDLLERAERMELTATLVADREDLLLDFWEPTDPVLLELLERWDMTLEQLGIDPEQNAWCRMEANRRRWSMPRERGHRAI